MKNKLIKALELRDIANKEKDIFVGIPQCLKALELYETLEEQLDYLRKESKNIKEKYIYE